MEKYESKKSDGIGKSAAELEIAEIRRDWETRLSKAKNEIVEWPVGFFLGRTGLMISGIGLFGVFL